MKNGGSNERNGVESYSRLLLQTTAFVGPARHGIVYLAFPVILLSPFVPPFLVSGVPLVELFVAVTSCAKHLMRESGEEPVATI